MKSVFNIVPSWEIGLFDQNGEPLAVFESFENFTIQRKLNDVSTFSVTFKDNGDDRLGDDYWLIDGQVQFIRDLPYFSDDMGKGYFPDVELSGLIRKVTKSIASSGEKIITFEGVSCEHLLSRRVIAALEGTIRADKSAPADQVMCEYVYENCGEGATAAAGRQFVAVDGTETIPPIIIDAPGVMRSFHVDFPVDGGEAPVWSGSRSMENLLDVLQDISVSKQVDFRVEYVGGAGFQFTVHPYYGIGHNRTWDDLNPSTGENRYGRAPVVFSIETENVTDMEAVLDRLNEGNFVFILGQGEASTRNVYPAANTTDVNASPWNQIEIARSASNQDALYQLQASAEETLAELAYKETIKFTPYQIPKALYGEHYFIGDFVTVNYRFFAATQRIVGVNFNYDSNGESIELVMESQNRVTEASQPEQPADHMFFLPILATSASPSISESPSVSESPSLSPSASLSPSYSESISASASVSISPSRSLSVSPSGSPSPSAPGVSPSRSLSPSASVSRSVSRSVSPSVSRSISPSRSVSASVSPSPSPLMFSASSEHTSTTGGVISWTHDPGALTPNGALVFIIQEPDWTDRVTSVFYGSEAMTRVARNFKQLSETAAVYAYFVGSSLDGGPQTVQVTITGGLLNCHFVCLTLEGDTDLQVEDSDISINSNSIANPTGSLSSGGNFIACAIGFFSGRKIGDWSPRAGWTHVFANDFANSSSAVHTYDTIDDLNVTCGWTQAADDGLAVAVSIREV